VFRRGARTFELTRELPNGSLALEDCLTRLQVVYTRNKLLKLVWAGDLVLAGADDVLRDASGKGVPAPPALEQLSPKARAELERRLAYVTAVQKAHLTRGNRSAIQALTLATAARIGDRRVPSASTVMTWLRRYELGSCYAGVLVSGYVVRRTGTRLPKTLEAIVNKVLQRDFMKRGGLSLRDTHAAINAEAAQKVRQGELDPGFARVSLATLSRRVLAQESAYGPSHGSGAEPRCPA